MAYDTDNVAAATSQTSSNTEQTTPSNTVRHSMKKPELHIDTIERQRQYVAEQRASGGFSGVIFQKAFIRGMRDLGYKDPAWALAELVDNAVQAAANKVEIRFNFDKDNTSQAKNPTEIAIIDNGNGMHPDMIGYAVRWGGTDRLDDRRGFGRFGYGLPSSCVSIACKYTVYSKNKGGQWHAVTVDLEKLASASADLKATEELLQPRAVRLPEWLAPPVTDSSLNVSQLESGTVIVLEDLDRLRGMTGWVQRKALQARLLQQFGVIYRHWIPDVRIVVDGDSCQSVDPLFLLPNGKHYDETSVMAKKIAERAFEVTAKNGEKGTVRIRAAYLHPQFSWATPEDLSSGAKKNNRWDTALQPKRGLNGLLICREGRQVDVVPPTWTKFQNYDVYVKIEIDFDPVLDEFFSITTSKQQVRIEEKILDTLRAAGANSGNLDALISDIRRQFEADNNELKAKVKNLAKETATELPAANAMAEAEKFKTKTPVASDETKAKAKQALEEEVAARTRGTGRSEEDVRKEIAAEAVKRPWDIEFKAMDEGPFYIPKRMDTQRRIVLNTSHPFYSRLYARSTGDVTSALEVLLFVLADGELDAEGERAEFYKSERGHHWSNMLSHALLKLVPQSDVDRETSLQMDLEEPSAASSK